MSKEKSDPAFEHMSEILKQLEEDLKKHQEYMNKNWEIAIGGYYKWRNKSRKIPFD